MNDNIEALESTTFAGRRFTRKMLAQIQETVDAFSNLSQRELGQTICEHLRWVTPGGKNKIHSCLKALEQMEKTGLITLPVKKKLAKKSRQKPIQWTNKTAEQEIIDVELAQLGSIKLKTVTRKDDILLWNEYVDRYHYLGYRRPIGTHLRYVIYSSKHPDRILGCLFFSATAVWSLSCRDRWIGWKEKDRAKRLNLILNNGRLLIFPWVKVKHLASKVLSMAAKQVSSDWEEQHGYRPLLLETFVNPTRYKGTSYQAANWQYLGQTSGQSDKEEGVKKDVYVYPLTRHFREVLTNQKSTGVSKNTAKRSDKLRSDDPFVQMWQRITNLVYYIAQEYDQKWQKRSRIINTMLIILFVFRLVFSKNKQGYGTTINELWEQCRKMDFPLPQAKPVAASAFCEARKKMDENIFKTINTEIIKTCEHREIDHLWKGRRLFAVDGSKINLPRQLKSDNYPLPSHTAYYPQGLVSCLYQLKSKIPYDFDLDSNYNERKLAMNHLKILMADDVVIYDRGYFSYLMLYCHIERKIDVVFRIQKGTYKVIDEFMACKEIDQMITINPSSEVRRKTIAQRADIQIVPLQMRMIKYSIAGETYILGTTLMDSDLYKTDDFCDLYHSRWGIEELYKISKTLIEVDDFHGHSKRGVKQELFAHFVLVTVSRIFSNKVEKDFLDEDLEKDTGKNPQSTRFRVNFKNSLTTIARNLEGLFILHMQLVSETIHTILSSLSRCKQKERPGRSYARQSKKPIKKWNMRKSQKAMV